MEVEFAPAAPQAATEENIIVAGEVVGTVKTAQHDPTRFHAALDLKRVSRYLGPIQGFGPTREAAIIDAFRSGEANARTMISEIEGLKEWMEV